MAQLGGAVYDPGKTIEVQEKHVLFFKKEK